MPYWRNFYHLVWSTDRRLPMIRPAMVDVIERSIHATAKECGAYVHAVGIMPDHVHVAASIPPKIAVATFVGRLKGAASHLINDVVVGPADEKLVWQAEYGVVTFGVKALEAVVAYVNNQESHLQTATLRPSLERVAEREPASAGFLVERGPFRAAHISGRDAAPDHHTR